jgi:hypothetical protein
MKKRHSAVQIVGKLRQAGAPRQGRLSTSCQKQTGGRHDRRSCAACSATGTLQPPDGDRASHSNRGSVDAVW